MTACSSKVGKQAHRPTHFTQLTRRIDLYTPLPSSLLLASSLAHLSTLFWSCSLIFTVKGHRHGNDLFAHAEYELHVQYYTYRKTQF